ncbi:MAG: flagellar biosynthesis anti-sigma factor FlgM [Deltaproteobacteria bacterium]|jgi:flagellar biosynthesis anti-sigma factor FlgM|nr:flagellar biosynthesis anti-sigma factor FlgM [Deltaproteobacteria bacterium]MBT4527879.1 flagellar biosynthesis anti-sigma factor FlgM [Deltaproteobacteria bacterium]
MKVDGQYPKIPLKDKSVQKGNEKDALSKNKDNLKSADQIKNIKSDTFAVNRLKDKINATEEIDLKKVEALRAQIKKGDYKINAETLADKLLKDSIFEDL